MPCGIRFPGTVSYPQSLARQPGLSYNVLGFDQSPVLICKVQSPGIHDHLI